jgi:hypothetical protein
MAGYIQGRATLPAGKAGRHPPDSVWRMSETSKVTQFRQARRPETSPEGGRLIAQGASQLVIKESRYPLVLAWLLVYN